MANKLNNCYLINAPAGSGKTTEIKSIVQRCIIDNPKDNILCITYTNRAADELSKGILSKNVFIGTIHSFLHFFLKPYFAHQDILELYFEIYGAQISERIDNKSQKESIAESNARYIEKYGKLDYDMVRNNIKVLSYNESPFSSLYYGGLSHDDLIGFSKAIFPVVEVVHVADYLCNPRVSTQHGVKGESHDSVVFVAEDSSNNPCVAMYRFFEMWGQIQISAKTLNQFYYNFAAEVDNIQQSIGIKGSVLKKGTYIANEEMIKAKLHTVFDRFKDDPYFQFIYGADYESYFSKPGVTKARDCLKGNTAYSILSAYKLFYVGCSRARRNLTILLDSSKIKGNLEPQKKRFEEIGFQVVSSPIH